MPETAPSHSSAQPVDRAARLAEGWIASPSLTREEARVQADLYRERCAAYGRQPCAIALRRDVYVGESSAEAQEVLERALSQGYRGIAAEALIAGPIDKVAEQFRTLSGKSGTPTSSCAISLTISQRCWALWNGWRRCALP